MKLDTDSWNLGKKAKGLRELPLAESLSKLASQYPEVLVLSADVASINGLDHFAERYPENFLNFGINEMNMVSAAGGLATCGWKPYVAAYSCFLALLCYEQIRIDVDYPNLPVRFLGHHSGISMGYYGYTHHSLEDITVLRSMANMTIICPADNNAIRSAIIATVNYPGPIYFRMGRGSEPQIYGQVIHDFQVGEAIQVRDGDDATIISTGVEVAPSLKAAESLSESGLEVRVLDMHTIKPIDKEAICTAASETGAILTVEDQNILGGLGGAVAEVLAESSIDCKFKRVGLDEYSKIGPTWELYKYYGLDENGIANAVMRMLHIKD